MDGIYTLIDELLAGPTLRNYNQTRKGNSLDPPKVPKVALA